MTPKRTMIAHEYAVIDGDHGNTPINPGKMRPRPVDLWTPRSRYCLMNNSGDNNNMNNAARIIVNKST